MGFRVRRRARILPGLSLNLSKSGHSSLPARERQAGHTRYGQRIGGKISGWADNGLCEYVYSLFVWNPIPDKHFAAHGDC